MVGVFKVWYSESPDKMGGSDVCVCVFSEQLSLLRPSAAWQTWLWILSKWLIILIVKLPRTRWNQLILMHPHDETSTDIISTICWVSILDNSWRSNITWSKCREEVFKQLHSALCRTKQEHSNLCVCVCVCAHRHALTSRHFMLKMFWFKSNSDLVNRHTPVKLTVRGVSSFSKALETTKPQHFNFQEHFLV